MSTDTLICAAGHEWTRPKTRGNRPRWCPEHRPARPTPAPAVEPSSKADPLALELLTGGTVLDPEFEHKLTYVVEQLDDPCTIKVRDAGDINLLVRVQKELLNDARRQYKL